MCRRCITVSQPSCVRLVELASPVRIRQLEKSNRSQSLSVSMYFPPFNGLFVLRLMHTGPEWHLRVLVGSGRHFQDAFPLFARARPAGSFPVDGPLHEIRSSRVRVAHVSTRPLEDWIVSSSISHQVMTIIAKATRWIVPLRSNSWTSLCVDSKP